MTDSEVMAANCRLSPQ